MKFAGADLHPICDCKHWGKCRVSSLFDDDKFLWWWVFAMSKSCKCVDDLHVRMIDLLESDCKHREPDDGRE